MTDNIQSDERRRQQRAIRATVWVLALVALAFYVSAFFKAWR